MPDEHGYPTDDELAGISRFNEAFTTAELRDLFAYLRSLWWMPEWGWHEKSGDEPGVTRYEISTGGWSGNEEILTTFERECPIPYFATWESSRRGGHFVFEIREPARVELPTNQRTENAPNPTGPRAGWLYRDDQTEAPWNWTGLDEVTDTELAGERGYEGDV
jgi:hypothetical protein